MQGTNIVSYWKILLPISIGLLVVGYMFYTEVSVEVLQGFTFSWRGVAYLLLAFIFMSGRDLGYIWRIRLFSDKQLSWRQSFRVIMLWELASAITPSTVGGTSVAVVFVHKEGLSIGKSATMVMLTAFFDELFFVILFPLIILLVGSTGLFAFDTSQTFIYLILAGYLVKLFLVLLLSYGLFINSKGLKWVIVKLFSLPFLRRWSSNAQKTGDDIVLSAKEIKNFRFSFWFKVSLATTLSWCSRFLVANAIFMAFFYISDHLLVFARQMVMWIPMIISPTPGGSGFAEYLFTHFLSDILPSSMAVGGSIALVALIWRVVTYYPYLLIGVFIVPRWFSSKFRKPAVIHNHSSSK